MSTKDNSPLHKTRSHADGIFAALFVGLTPVITGLAYFSTRWSITSTICTAAKSVPLIIGGGWPLALMLAGPLALGSVLIWKLRPGQRLGTMYNAVTSMVFSALIMHFGGGAGEAHFPFFIFTSFLLYYRSWRPIGLACAVILAHHLGFFALQSVNVPVVVFHSVDGRTLLVHLAAGVGQCALLGYIASKMEKSDLALMQSTATQKLAAKVFHKTIEGIVVTDAHGCIESVNPAFTQITGYSEEEVIGKTPRVWKSNHHDAGFYQEMWRVIEHTGQWAGEVWNRRKSGEVYLQEQTIQRIESEDGVDRYVAVFNDITEQRRKDEHIEYLAFHDSLTSLANRSMLADRLKQAISLADGSGSELAVVFVDLDNFKHVNDTFGHDKGDDLLKVVAARLQTVVRQTDTVARLGGDEFVLVLQPCGRPEEIAATAERVINQIAAPIDLSGLSLRVGASIGIAVYPGDGVDVASLMKGADTAMYDAKAAGKGTYRFFSAELAGRAQARLRLEMDLRKAIEQREFELHYQPKICLQLNSPCGAEALIRWRHPLRGLVPPMEFIPVAEETGLIEPIGDWVLEEACRQLSLWKASGTGLDSLAVNVSALQLQRGTLAKKIRELLVRYRLPGEALEIELTESAVMRNPDQAIETMSAIRSLGVRIAVDDFGTGHSSLAYLKRLPLDTLKIDRSFVKEAHHDEESAVICSAILGLARSLNLDVVAEGVETSEQLAFLRKQGCTMAQGYYFSRPRLVDDLEKWLDEQSDDQLRTLRA
ncbi:putative bifunctional diguanylate cyclase/phosphodiesterase [Paraburkholderia dinghuensis]|uniref:EAL domain-containing protein n=1 Tax=Paraburkholderia dinghuensis TaxID=2305225 RepID=A0A3N6PSM5_9BURK|nr:EAL domain-containing protein [Paraburkholderia dinghuensis]RQH04990.1 EAL domain-containing protein [Paraburkholderia dinghuensis]